MEQFTAEESRILSNFMTNTDKPIFVLKNLPEVVKGALFSRYSRTDKSLRRVLLDEFINKPESGFKAVVNFQTGGVEEAVAINKAEEFYERVFVEYGDDSVAELGGAHAACEGVSQLAAKALEDPRIGISPLEKSTRYILFNEKAGGEYRFCREPVIMGSEFADLYVKINNMLFDAYSRLVEPMKKFVTEGFPQPPGMTDRAYNFTIKAKACDVLRVFLPASTLTNVGIFGNGRSLEYLLIRLRASPLQEMQDIAASLHGELGKVMPPFMKRVYGEHGNEWVGFMKETDAAMEKKASGVLGAPVAPKPPGVELIDWDEHAVDKITEAILYQYSEQPLSAIRSRVAAMAPAQKNDIIQEYLKRRQNRRHKPGRAFETAYYTFDVLGNYGIYRDLHRHRIQTQMRQLLSTKNGYDTPKELAEAGFADTYHEAMEEARNAHEEIAKRFPKEAQYVVPFGYRIRWLISLNARQVFHMVELRTIKQGHPDYRKICQDIFRNVRHVHPQLVENMKFVDMNAYEMERDEAEKRIDEKLERIKKKYG